MPVRMMLTGLPISHVLTCREASSLRYLSVVGVVFAVSSEKARKAWAVLTAISCCSVVFVK
jgi:hypothetical protein